MKLSLNDTFFSSYVWGFFKNWHYDLLIVIVYDIHKIRIMTKYKNKTRLIDVSLLFYRRGSILDTLGILFYLFLTISLWNMLFLYHFYEEVIVK